MECAAVRISKNISKLESNVIIFDQDSGNCSFGYLRQEYLGQFELEPLTNPNVSEDWMKIYVMPTPSVLEGKTLNKENIILSIFICEHLGVTFLK